MSKIYSKSDYSLLSVGVHVNGNFVFRIQFTPYNHPVGQLLYDLKAFCRICYELTDLDIVTFQIAFLDFTSPKSNIEVLSIRDLNHVATITNYIKSLNR